MHDTISFFCPTLSSQPDSVADAEGPPGEISRSVIESSNLEETSSRRVPTASSDGDLGPSGQQEREPRKLGAMKRRAPSTTGLERPNKLAKVTGSDTNLALMDSNSQPASFGAPASVEPSGRSLRQRTAGTWYGVDLEYDDDDDDEADDDNGGDDDDDDDMADADEDEEAAAAGGPEDNDDYADDDASRSRNVRAFSKRRAHHGTDDEDVDDTSRVQPWAAYEDSITDPVGHFARVRGDEEPTWSSPAPMLDGTFICERLFRDKRY